MTKNYDKQDNLFDLGAERALIGTILNNGYDTFLEISDILINTDFSLPINQQIYRCIQELASNPKCEGFDIESIKMQAKTLGIGSRFEDGHKESEYLELIKSSQLDATTCKNFAFQIKKLSIVRELRKQCSLVVGYIDKLDGSESLSDILEHSEKKISDSSVPRCVSSGAAGSLKPIWNENAGKIRSEMKFILVKKLGSPIVLLSPKRESALSAL